MVVSHQVCFKQDRGLQFKFQRKITEFVRTGILTREDGGTA